MSMRIPGVPKYLSKKTLNTMQCQKLSLSIKGATINMNWSYNLLHFTSCYVRRYPSLALENENSYFEPYVFYFLIQFAVGTCNVRDSSLVYISGNMTNTLSLVRLCTLRNKSVTYDNGIWYALCIFCGKYL